MPQIKDEILIGMGGLDQDSDERFVTNGDSSYRLNVINTQIGSEYVLSNLKGNTKVSHSFTHASAYYGSIYICVGDCYDPIRDAIYLFIYSTGGNDSILRFNFSDQSFDKIVFDHTELGFDPDYPITDAFMIGDRLHWNPRTSSPRAINVQWAYYDINSYYGIPGTTRAVGDYVRRYSKVYVVTEANSHSNPIEYPNEFTFLDYIYDDAFGLNAEDIDPAVTNGTYFRYRKFYNIPDTIPYAPKVAVGTDTNYEYNNIRGRRFQFCYRNYIKDQGYSISSQYTDIIAASASETTYGEVVRDISAFNKIDVSMIMLNLLPDGVPWYEKYMLFEFTEVLFREGSTDNWKVAERINYEEIVSSTTATGDDYYTISFYNDKAYEVVDNASVEKQFNALPLKADAQWSLDGQRCAYGGVTEGFDVPVDIDISMTVNAKALTVQEGSGAVQDTITFSGTWDDTDKVYTQESSHIELGTAAASDVIQVTVNGNLYSYTLSTADDNDDESYAAAVRSLLLQAGEVFYSEASSPGYVLTRTRPFLLPDIGDVTRYSSATTLTESVKVGSFKNGAWHPFCQFYYDEAGRRSEPVITDDMRVYVDTLPEALNTATDSTNYQRTISWSVAHLPPAWATHWRWGYAGNQTIGDFWQYNLAAVDVGESKGSGSDVWTRLDITPLQGLADETELTLGHYFPNTTITAYSYEEGDRIRFITKDVTKPATNLGLLVAASNDDYEILEFDDTNNYIYIANLSAAVTVASSIIVEIYRPQKQTGTTVFYEFGPLYSTYTDSGVLYHKGEEVDQDVSTDASGEFTAGDVWVITRTFSLEASSDNIAFVESYGWSDFHETDGWAKGKVGTYTGIGQKYLNNVRYGNKYEPNSQSSGVSTFDFLDYKPMGFAHGKITAMRQVGHTLKVYFERNSASVMVNSTQFYSQDGVSQILKSDNVLGDVAYSNYHYGTIFPESVCLKDRTVYFYDIYRDAYIQDSANGVSAISDAKMVKYFKDKSEALLTSGISNVKVYSTYDYDRDLLYVNFVDEADDSNDECVVYSDRSKRWITFTTWEYDGSLSGEIFTTSLPESSGTTPGFTLSGSYTTQYYNRLTADDTGVYGSLFTSTGTNLQDVLKGDEISIVFNQIYSVGADIPKLLFVRVEGTGGVVSVLKNLNNEGGSYTYTHTATADGTVQVRFSVASAGSVTAGDYVDIRWVPTITRYVSPLGGKAISNLCSYTGEDVWLHNSNATRNNLWGSQEDSVVRVVSAMQPNVVKEFLAMAIHSNARWDVTNITIPATINYPNGMESLIPEGHFEEDEGVLRSDYLCNMKTTSSVATVPDLLNGDNLRGYIISHDLTSDDTTEIYLFKVDVSSNISKQ